jgi:hypothetical protein
MKLNVNPQITMMNEPNHTKRSYKDAGPREHRRSGRRVPGQRRLPGNLLIPSSPTMHLITSAIRIANTCLVAKPSMPATDPPSSRLPLLLLLPLI